MPPPLVVVIDVIFFLKSADYRVDRIRGDRQVKPSLQVGHQEMLKDGIRKTGESISGLSLITSERQFAFTLIEAMVAVMITAIGMISALQLLTFSHVQNDLEQERSRAHQIVCEEMERLRHELYTRITGGTTVTIWDNGTPDDTTDDTVGTLEVIVRDTNGGALTAAPVPAVRVQVEVTLTWNPRGSRHTNTFRESVMSYIAP